VPAIEVWNQFDHDPRIAANAATRASDRDRGVIESVLADAFAEGRLTHTEYDERSDAAFASRTLGDLMPLVSDLPISRAPRSSVAEEAARSYVETRRQAIGGFFSVSLICWTIWLLTGHDFPWPVFVLLGTGLNAARITWQKDAIIEEETRRLEKKERKALEKRSQRED